MQKRERRRFAAAGRPDQRDAIARQRRETQIRHRGALAIVRKRHILNSTRPRKRPGSTASGRSRTAGTVSMHAEELGELRRIHEQAVGKADHLLEPADQERRDRHEADDLADRREPYELEISSDQEDREQRERGGGARQHGRHCPPRQHRHLRAQERVHQALQRRYFKFDAGKALHHGDVAERIGGVLGEIGVMPLDRALHRFGPVHDQHGHHRECGAQRRATAAPAASSSTSDVGSSTTMKTKAAKCSRKNETHSHHSVSVPVSMIFNCRPECAPEW